MANKNKEFFNEMSEQSEAKTEIVRKYFWAWATVISRQVIKMRKDKIAYVDLFAGPGRYQDGTPSTPIRILEGAIRDKHIAPLLAALFNDEDSNKVEALEKEIKDIAGINTLRYQPVVRNYQVDDALASKFDSWKIPTLFFLDPFGYKGLSLRLIESALKPWGSDCIFFFNYNRINAALSNPVFTENMNSFFGEARADRLRANLAGKKPAERQALIIEELKHALRELGGQYSIEYYFKDDSGEKTSHFLIFASKNVLGYDIMKSIMAGESSSDDHGVASFGFNPRDKQKALDKEKNPTFFDLTDPVSALGESLLDEFAGRTLTMDEIYKEHHVDKGYILRNYQDALRQLETAGRITANPPASERLRRGLATFGKNVAVTFPAKKG